MAAMVARAQLRVGLVRAMRGDGGRACRARAAYKGEGARQAEEWSTAATAMANATDPRL